MTPLMQTSARERGSVMVISLISLIPVLALVMYSLVRTTAEAQAEEVRGEADRAAANALSGIELAKAEINASDYYESGVEAGRNQVVWDAINSDALVDLRWNEVNDRVMAFRHADGRRTWIESGQMGEPGDDLFAYRRLGQYGLSNGESVTVWIAALDGLWHLIEAEATVNRVRRTARIFVRERDPFTRYNLFVDDVTQPVSVSMTGNVHSNQKLKYYYGGLNLGGYMTAVNGFEWLLGADWTNINFNDGFDDSAGSLELPSLENIRDRLRPPVRDADTASVDADYIYVGSNYESCDVTLQGDEVIVRATEVDKTTSEIIYTGSIADIRRIYAVPEVAIRGDLFGRLSVASESEAGVTIDGNIRYVDEDGDPAYGGGGGTTGSVIDSVDEYQPNPDYDGNSSLGIMAANGDITYVTANDTDLEIHAALFSQGQLSIPGIKLTGPWAEPPFNDMSIYSQGLVYGYDSSVKPRFLLTVGMSVSARHKLRGIVNTRTGVRYSGFENGAYIYDAQLQSNPPPYFIDIERPLFRGRHLLEGRYSQ